MTRLMGTPAIAHTIGGPIQPQCGGTDLTGNSRKRKRPAFSMLEMLWAVTIVGILAAIIIIRVANQPKTARKNACAVNTGNVEVQCQLWFRHKSAWPATNLSDIGADGNYFPDGLPTCPVDGSSYTISGATGLVIGHQH